MPLQDIIGAETDAATVISALKKKTVAVPAWERLRNEYEARLHPVMTDPDYIDKIRRGKMEKVTRITLPWQKLAAKRMTELMFSTPVKRVYKPKDDAEKRVSEIMEAIFRKNRADSMNVERGRALFASCEFVTVWYAQEQPTDYAGERSLLKLRSKTYSPMTGAAVYPLFDEYDDLVALSVEYTRTEGADTVTYFETYTADEHIRWRTSGGAFAEEVRERISLGKIPGIYLMRPEPIWEDQSNNVYEAEWTLSRNGNYIRKNARPVWVVFSESRKVTTGKEPTANDNAGRDVLRYGPNDKAGYVTWQQAIESIKYHIEEIKRDFFMALQLPDMSMDSMKSTPMSGEARKMLFLDAQMKVTDESGRWLDALDREVNVVRAYMKAMYPSMAAAIDSLIVETVITPYQIHDEEAQVNKLMAATGGKAIMSQRTAVSNLGYVDDVDEELSQIASESVSGLFTEPTI